MTIDFSKYDFKIEENDGRKRIYDIVRKKFIVLTPEEWVRQHWIHYLIEEKKFPRSRMAVEMSIKVNRLARRSDIVVFDKNGHPHLIVECKAPEVRLTQKAFEQVARYNLSLKVKYLIVSNAKKTFAAEMNYAEKKFLMMEDIPEYSEY